MRDNKKHTADDVAPKKSPGRIFQQEVAEGKEALDRSNVRIFMSALLAGLELGLSLLFISIIKSMDKEGQSPLTMELLSAAMYSFGFVVVILGRSELFTEQTTLAILPWLTGKTTLAKVAELWGIVLIGNLIGAIAGAAAITVIVPALKVGDSQVFGEIASQIVGYPGWVIILSGILAGWLMGLLSWLVAAGRDTISQIVLIVMFTSGIGLSHAHHAVLGTTEVVAGVFSGMVSWSEYGRFLLFATIGNSIGGAVFVALFKFGHARPE